MDIKRRLDMDIKCRTGQANKAFMDMRNVLCARKIGMGIRKRLLVLLLVTVTVWMRVMDDTEEHWKRLKMQRKCGFGEE